MSETLTRSEKLAESKFEWVKTERTGEVCYFSEIISEGGDEYILFTDGSRVNSSLLGDVVLIHDKNAEILGDLLSNPPVSNPQPQNQNPAPLSKPTPQPQPQKNVEIDPVKAILTKTKRKKQNLNLTISVNLPSKDLYLVVKENFPNMDDVLLEDVMDQIKEKALRDSLKKELNVLYSTKKRRNS
jgi:hypothetical protein